MGRRSIKSGLPPGSLVHVGSEKSHKIEYWIIDYNKDSFLEKRNTNLEECVKYKNNETVTWINVTGIHDVDVLQKIGERFDIHPLILEDIMNTTQRPKLEDMESYIYLVVRMLGLTPKNSSVSSEQVSFIITPRYILSFLETPGDIFEPVRERIRTGKGKMRTMGADYLLYCLVDTIVDNYFVILEHLGDKIEYLEDEVIKSTTPKTLKSVYSFKRELITLRRSIWPLREVINAILRSDSKILTKQSRIYFRDIYDHIVEVIDTIETYRDIVAGMLDTYLSSLSNRMNEVMKV
ncbi:MAG: magnesium/cobalt transporter CorA, partial [Candidatus Altiarchaeota archaeon]|nr:magnesium/cobalt transporter CorA [Candidatus Altiarchaeota archaeon]